MKNKYVIALLVLLSLTSFVLAQEFIALQGNINQAGVNLRSGDVVVMIYDSYSGGTLVYNSSTDFYGNISNGRYDLVLGNTSQALNLNYGQVYYIEIAVNGSNTFETFTFDGKSRQAFYSSVGNVSFGDVTGSANLVFVNQSLPAGQNISAGAGGWFRGLFNWSILAASEPYLEFDGANLQITNNITDWSFNQSNLVYNFNQSDLTYNFNQSTGIPGVWTTNATAFYNASALQIGIGLINPSYLLSVNGSTNLSGTTWILGVNSSQWLFNQSDLKFNFNQSNLVYNFNQSSLNGVYALNNSVAIGELIRSGNIALATLNVTNVFRVGTSTIHATASGINISGEVNFDSRWADGGVTIDGSSGAVYAQVLYVYNITSVGVNSLEMNGTIVPRLNNTFDIGNASNNYRDVYVSSDVNIAGTTVKQWLFNQSNLAWYSTSFYNNATPFLAKNFNVTQFDDAFKTNVSGMDVEGWASNATAIWTNATVLQVGIGQVTASEALNVTGKLGVTGEIWSAGRNVTNFAFNQSNLVYNFNQSNLVYNFNQSITFAENWTGNGSAIWTRTGISQVGIGTSTPSAPLQVSGTNVSMKIYGGDTTESAHLYLSGRGLDNRRWSITQYGATGDANAYDLVIDEDTGQSIGDFIVTPEGNISLDGSTFWIDGANNRVGIGTSLSSFKLDVHDATAQPQIRANGTTWTGLRIDSTNNAAARNYFVGSNFLQYGDFGIIQSNAITGNPASLSTGTARFYINASGSVGIGTSSPGEKVEIFGDANYFELNQDGTDSYTGIKFSESGTYKGIIQYFGGTYTTAARQNNLELITATGDIILQRDGVNKVGIGTDAPTHTLNVVGDINLTGNLSVGGASISSGKVAINATGSTFGIVGSERTSGAYGALGYYAAGPPVISYGGYFQSSGTAGDFAFKAIGDANITGITTSGSNESTLRRYTYMSACHVDSSSGMSFGDRGTVYKTTSPPASSSATLYCPVQAHAGEVIEGFGVFYGGGGGASDKVNVSLINATAIGTTVYNSVIAEFYDSGMNSAQTNGYADIVHGNGTENIREYEIDSIYGLVYEVKLNSNVGVGIGFIYTNVSNRKI